MNYPNRRFQVRRSWPYFRFLFFICAALSAAGVLTGCTAMGRKFESTPKADMNLFADNTMAMLNDLDLAVSRNETIYVRRFMDYSQPEEKKVLELSQQMRQRLFDVVKYSLYIVSLAESGKTEPEKVAAYDIYLTDSLDRLKARSVAPSDYLDDRLTLIRQQENLLGALRTAQPIINTIGTQTSMALNDIILAVEALTIKLDQKIDAAYTDVNQYQIKLQEEKYTILKALEYIHQANRGDKEALRQLKTKGYFWDTSLLPKGDRMTYKDFLALLDHLTQRLDTQHRIQQELAPELKAYRETHQELIRLQDETMRRISRMRVIMMVWVRAHQKMATGITDPAEWFDLKQTPKMLIDMGKDVIF